IGGGGRLLCVVWAAPPSGWGGAGGGGGGHPVGTGAGPCPEPGLGGRPPAAARPQEGVVLCVGGVLGADPPQPGHHRGPPRPGTGVRTFAASTSVAGISAPVGQACTHSPQATQVELAMGSSKSNTIFSP